MQFKVIKITSSQISEAVNLFQRLFTNDILNKSYSHNLLMTNQAKFISEIFIRKFDDCLFIETPIELLSSLVQKINLYKIGLKLNIAETNYQVLYTKDLDKDLRFFDTRPKSNPEPNKETLGQKLLLGKIIYYEKDPRSINLGYRIIYEPIENQISSSITVDIEDSKNTIQEILSGSLITYLLDKYLYCIIDYIDLNETSFIPKFNMEFSFDKHKGCYIGQEVISRANNSATGYQSFSFKIESKIIDLLTIYKTVKVDQDITLIPHLNIDIFINTEDDNTKIGALTSILIYKNQIFCLGYYKKEFDLISNTPCIYLTNNEKEIVLIPTE